MLAMKPSEYFKRQRIVGCEGEECEVGAVIQLMGDDNKAARNDPRDLYSATPGGFRPAREIGQRIDSPRFGY